MTQHPAFNGDRRFAFELAQELGRPDVDDMLEEMSALLFEEWKSFYRVKGWEHEEQMKKAKK